MSHIYHIAITRTDPDDPTNVDKYTPGEKVDLETALMMYTVNSAYMVGKEDMIGSIEAGKKADLIVLDRNIFEIPTKELLEVNVLATMVDGRVVHEEAVDWSLPKHMLDLVPPDFCGSSDEQHEHK